jgi:hypothetical protein
MYMTNLYLARFLESNMKGFIAQAGRTALIGK